VTAKSHKELIKSDYFSVCLLLRKYLREGSEMNKARNAFFHSENTSKLLLTIAFFALLSTVIAKFGPKSLIIAGYLVIFLAIVVLTRTIEKCLSYKAGLHYGREKKLGRYLNWFLGFYNKHEKFIILNGPSFICLFISALVVVMISFLAIFQPQIFTNLLGMYVLAVAIGAVVVAIIFCSFYLAKKRKSIKAKYFVDGICNYDVWLQLDVIVAYYAAIMLSFLYVFVFLAIFRLYI